MNKKLLIHTIDYLKQEITRGIEQLPTVREIARAKNVSISTVHQAMQQLKNEGILYTYQGKGTFIKPLATEANNAKIISPLETFISEKAHWHRNKLGPEIIMGAMHELSNWQIGLLVNTIPASVDETDYYLKNIKKRRISGYLLFEMMHSNKIIDCLNSSGIPYVFINVKSRELCSDKYNCVISNETAGITEAVDYLFHLGHKKIGFIGNSIQPGQEMNPLCNRLQSFKQACKEKNGQEPDNRLIKLINIQDDIQFDSALHELLQSKIHPTAIFAEDDHFALKVINYAKKNKIEIPRDLSLVGFDNNPLGELIEPQLTTVDKPRFEMGKESVRLILGQIFKTMNVPIQKIIKTQLIVRKSCQLAKK